MDIRKRPVSATRLIGAITNSRRFRRENYAVYHVALGELRNARTDDAMLFRELLEFAGAEFVQQCAECLDADTALSPPPGLPHDAQWQDALRRRLAGRFKNFLGISWRSLPELTYLDDSMA